jgi:predicted phage gp36 major capsid-like protein
MTWPRIVDIGQPLMLRDQVTSKGRTLFYAEKRVCGGILDFNAGKLLVMSA